MNFAQFSMYVAREDNDEKAHVLSENMGILNKEGFFGLYVSVQDNDRLHVQEHSRFLKEHLDEIAAEQVSLMKAHIAQHAIQYSEKEKMGIVIREADPVIDGGQIETKIHFTPST